MSKILTLMLPKGCNFRAEAFENLLTTLQAIRLRRLGSCNIREALMRPERMTNNSLRFRLKGLGFLGFGFRVREQEPRIIMLAIVGHNDVPKPTRNINGSCKGRRTLSHEYSTGITGRGVLRITSCLEAATRRHCLKQI